MVVVSNTSPLNYLILIGEVSLLPKLFGSVLVPEAVVRELKDPRAPSAVRLWAEQPPAWIEIRPVVVPSDPRLAELQAGEREALAVTLELGADLLLIDEIDAREEAVRRGIEITGTVGILGRAAERGLVDFAAAASRLRQTSFHISETVLRPFLERHARGAQSGSSGATGELEA